MAAPVLAALLALLCLAIAWDWAARRVRAARMRWRRRVGAVTLLAQQAVVLAIVARSPAAPSQGPAVAGAPAASASAAVPAVVAHAMGADVIRGAAAALAAGALGVLLAWPLDSRRRT